MSRRNERRRPQRKGGVSNHRQTGKVSDLRRVSDERPAEWQPCHTGDGRPLHHHCVCVHAFAPHCMWDGSPVEKCDHCNAWMIYDPSGAFGDALMRALAVRGLLEGRAA